MIIKKLLLVLFVWLFASNVASEEKIAIMALIKDSVILSVDGEHYKIQKNAPAVDGIKLLEISQNKKTVILEIDGIQRKFRLGHGTQSYIKTFKIFADESGVYRTKGKINDQEVSFVVDTGATLVSLNSNTAQQIGIDYLTTANTAQTETANGVVTVYLVNLESVKIGGIELNNIEAAIHEGEYPSQVLLGMSFLKHLKMEKENDNLNLFIR